MRAIVLGLKSWIWLVPVGIAVFAAEKTAQAVSHVADQVRYQCPAGWTEREQGDVCMLNAHAEKPGDMLVVVISSSQPRAVDLATQFQSLFTAVEVNAKRATHGQVQTIKREGLAVLMTTGRVDQPGVGEHDRIYELVSDDRHCVFVMAMVRGPATLSAHQAELLALLANVAPKPVGGENLTHTSDAVAGATVVATQPVSSSTVGIPYGGPAVVVLDKSFRPSGHGLPLPAPEIKDGAPLGVWWYVRVTSAGSSIMCQVFLRDGTLLGIFRPGGPAQVDVDGMRALGETGFIGTWKLANGQLTQAWGPEGRDVLSEPIDVHQSGNVPSFIWWHREYQPALLVDRSFVVGTWREGAMGTFCFNPDGTVATTANMIDASWGRVDSKEPVTGTWVLDGYLLAMHFPKDGDRVMTVFRTASHQLVLRQSMLTRE